MIFLAGEILACLTASLMIGLVTGWLLRGMQTSRRMKHLEKMYQINLASLKPGPSSTVR
ncbi:hypothetical protein JW948_12415 [bacterium]|nr:hypothetical protein [bacterium]